MADKNSICVRKQTAAYKSRHLSELVLRGQRDSGAGKWVCSGGGGTPVKWVGSGPGQGLQVPGPIWT